METVVTPIHATNTASREPFALAPLVIWLTLQLLALILGASGVAWSANYPTPADLQSVRLMLVVQITSVALLWPVLCRSRASTIAAAMTAWPFIYSAGFLSATPFAVNSLAAFYMTAWILSLGVLRTPFSLPLPPTTPAIVTTWVLAEPIFHYLLAEFAHRELPIFGPIFGVFSILDGAANWTISLAPLIVLTIGMILRALARRQ